MFVATSTAVFRDRLRRLLAGSCAALVLALTIFAASPTAHGLLHNDADTRITDDGCAVVLFANGVSFPVGPIAIIPPEVVTKSASPITAADVVLMSPRYLRRPERGPPIRWVA